MQYTAKKSNTYSVSDINKYVKNMFASDYLLKRVSVKGEVSNCKYHSSGHIYFSLKDAGGTLSCVMFGSARKGLTFSMKDGQQVIVSGTIDVFERDGRYQLYAREIEEEGLGSLYEQYLRLKEELQEMGMFDSSYKKKIPAYASRIGIVTASTGAAIRDIQNIAARRNPFVQLILCPAQVQGEGAAYSICNGIRRLDRAGVDVIIVGRGGGSIEDLWAFNERCVAEAIFACSTPVISAVGHETDTTISDYVADLRAPTPSAAAELAVWDYREYQACLDQFRQRLDRGMNMRLLDDKHMLALLEKRLYVKSPENRLLEQKHLCALYEEHILKAMEKVLTQTKHRFQLQMEKLEGLSPLSKLRAGYSYTQTSGGEALISIRQVTAGEQITIHVTDGLLRANITEISGKEN